MLSTIFAVFLILHGLVHLLYAGHSLRKFELQPGMTWPENSLLLSKLMSNKGVRIVIATACSLAALAFVTSGILARIDYNFYKTLVIYTSLFSIIVYIIAWDGKIEKVMDQGLANFIINFILILFLV